MLIIIILRFFLSFFQSLFVLKTGQKIDATLILGYYQHLLKLPQTFFDNMRTGEIISRIGDAVKIRVFVNDVSINLILNIFILVVSFILMFTFFWKLALIMILVVPYLCQLSIISQTGLTGKSSDVSWRGQLIWNLNLWSHLILQVRLKLFGLEEFSNLRTETRFVSLLEVIYKSGLNGIFSSTSTSLVSQVITVDCFMGRGWICH